MFTTMATFTASCLEWMICYLMASGKIDFDLNIVDKPIKYLFWALMLTHVREPHFYCIHRVMHPWRKAGIPDIGRILYKWAHSTHHKSDNTTAFSGTSMHPIESTMYYSAGLIPILFGCHPIVCLATMIDCGIGAWLGHSGFIFPGTGDLYH